MSLAFLVLGLIALVAGASLLVRGAAKLAVSFGISPLVVGLTVVAFGTSARVTLPSATWWAATSSTCCSFSGCRP
jgi:cation:H+ antiporter